MIDNRMKAVGAASLASALLCVWSASLDGAQQSSDLQRLSPEDLCELNQRNAKAVDTCVRVDRVVTQIKMLTGEEKRLRARITSGIMAYMDKVIASGAEGAVSESAMERSQASVTQQLERIDGQVLVVRLNKSRTDQRRSRIDFGASRQRTDVLDQRDLDGICKKNKLSKLDRMSLDRTRIIVQTEKGAFERLTRGRNEVVIPRGTPPRAGEQARQEFGIIPSWVRAGSELLERRDPDPQSAPSSVMIVGRDADTKNVAFDVTLRPDLDFLMTRLRRYDDEGDVVEHWSVSDFRRVEGVLVPFHITRKRSREGVSDYLVEQTSLQSIKLNVELPDKLFEMPKNVRVLGAP